MTLARFVAKRIVWGLVSLLVFLFLTYLAVGSLIPNDANALFPVMTQAELDEYRSRLGLERPLAVQFLIWFGGVMTGDLGRTTFGAPVATRIGDAMARTAFLFTLGLALAYGIGSWLGRRTGWRRTGLTTSGTLVAVLLGTAFPPFLAFVLTFLLRERSSVLADLRSSVVGDLRGAWADAGIGPTELLWQLTALLVVSVGLAVVAKQRLGWPIALTSLVSLSLAGGVWVQVTGYGTVTMDVLITGFVPLLAFTILAFGEFLLIGQAAMSGARHEDFVNAARARGLSVRRLRNVHGWTVARPVMLSRLAISIPYLVTGLVIIEQAVDWPGLGDFLFQALQGRDLPTIMSSLLILGSLTIVTRLVLDVLQRGLDPRLGPAVS